jgi:hypothetical protein
MLCSTLCRTPSHPGFEATVAESWGDGRRDHRVQRCIGLPRRKYERCAQQSLGWLRIPGITGTILSGTVLSPRQNTEKNFICMHESILSYARMQASDTPIPASCLDWEEKWTSLPSDSRPPATPLRGCPGAAGRAPAGLPCHLVAAAAGRRTRHVHRLLGEGCTRVCGHGAPWWVRCSRGWRAGVGEP